MRRKHERARTKIAIGVLRGTRRDVAYVKDVSASGMQLQGLVSAFAGERIVVHIRGLMLRAEIRWTKGTLCGIALIEDADCVDLKRYRCALPRLAQRGLNAAPQFRELRDVHPVAAGPQRSRA